MNKVYLTFVFLFLFFNLNASAQPDSNTDKLIGDFYKDFKAASYLNSLKTLDSLKNISGQQGFAYYWKGITLNKLQRFVDAIEEFKKAEEFKANYKDMYYEYGQALYAADKLELARKAFGKSVVNRHMTGVSLYYMGFISQNLEDYKTAAKYYREIESLPSEEKNEVLQAAQFQMAEVYLLQAEKDNQPKKLIKKFVIPQFKTAYKTDKKSGIAPQILKRIEELEIRYGITLDKMANGRPTNKPRLYLKLSQEFKYDTNVILQTSAVQNTAEDKSAPVSKTEVMSRYSFYPNNRISLIPEFKYNYSKHYGDEPKIYKNDTYTIAPAVRTSYEYTLFGKMSSHLFDYDYNYNGRDVYQKKDIQFNNRSYTFMFGQKWNFIPWGETTLRYKKKQFYSYLETGDTKTTTFGLEQLLNLPKSHVLFLIASFDQNKVRDNSQDTDATTLRLDWIIPRIRDWVTPTLSYTYMLNDPIYQKQDRGLEKMQTAGVKLTRGFGKLRANAKYDYTKNTSKNKLLYDYEKQIYALEIEYLF